MQYAKRLCNITARLEASIQALHELLNVQFEWKITQGFLLLSNFDQETFDFFHSKTLFYSKPSVMKCLYNHQTETK